MAETIKAQAIYYPIGWMDAATLIDEDRLDELYFARPGSLERVKDYSLDVKTLKGRQWYLKDEKGAE